MTNDEWGFGANRAIRHSSFVIQVLTLMIRAYQLAISPAQTFLFGPTAGCRFTPSCSGYALEAVREHGALAGGVLAAKRICRCHPWSDGGHDPVPGAENKPSPGPSSFGI